jgi:hypothetical protein
VNLGVELEQQDGYEFKCASTGPTSRKSSTRRRRSARTKVRQKPGPVRRLERNERGRYLSPPQSLPMLAFDDCLALRDLTEDEVLTAEHEHIPEMAALQLGNCPVHTPEGEMRIKSIIHDDIAQANARAAAARRRAELVLRNFILSHLCCDARHQAQLPTPERRQSAR